VQQGSGAEKAVDGSVSGGAFGTTKKFPLERSAGRCRMLPRFGGPHLRPVVSNQLSCRGFGGAFVDTPISSGDYWRTGLALSLPALLVLGCEVNVIRGLSPVQPIPAITAPLRVVVSGSGKCNEIEINWGDSYQNTYQSVDLGSNPEFAHSYGSGGGKTVTVEGKRGCEGKVTTRFVMEPSVFALAFNQIQRPTDKSAPTCVLAANHPGVRRRELIRITTSPAAGAPGGINFGCPFNGCIHDADGRPGSAADSRFPFPGFREYSLVLRVTPNTGGVPNQDVQGGSNMSFTSNVDGRLEICLNDHDMTNNSGGYQINIRVDQLGP
jgi:hypothetical protein